MGLERLPAYIPVSPMTLMCPRCGAKSGVACDSLKGEVDLVDVERIIAAADKDVVAKNARDGVL